MNVSFPFLALPIICDMLLPGSESRHRPLLDPNFVRMHRGLFEWGLSLILLAIFVAAFLGLRWLFRRRSKASLREAKAGDEVTKAADISLKKS